MNTQNKRRLIGLVAVFVMAFGIGLSHPISHVKNHFTRGMNTSLAVNEEGTEEIGDDVVWDNAVVDDSPTPVIYEDGKSYTVQKVAVKNKEGKRVIRRVKRDLNKSYGNYKHKGDPDYDKYAAGLDPEVYCLARAMYYEARGEGIVGQRAVGNVILNRVSYKHYFPNSVCGVISEKGQFQWYHNASLRGNQPFKVNVHTDIVSAAQQLMIEHNRGKRIDTTNSSFFFSANGVKPAPSAVYYKHVGKHAFYKLSMKWHKQQVAMKG